MDLALIVQRLQESSALKRRLAVTQADNIQRAGQALATAFTQGGKVLFFGNGGSAADAQHLAGELVGRFTQERSPLPAIALTTDTSALTALGNDYGFEHIFTRQMMALGQPGDVAVAISTSGRSPNVLSAVDAARARQLVTVGLTGHDGGPLALRVDIPIVVPSTNTQRIQECHITIGHLLCEIVESILFQFHQDEPGHATESLACPPLRALETKSVDWDTLLTLRARWRAEHKVVVWTNGCFDLLHVGHVWSLQAARRLGDVLIVGVNSDNSVRHLKGSGRPIVPAAERVDVLAALACVDYVLIFDAHTPEAVLSRLQPDIHCKGAEYAPEHGKTIPEAEVVASYGGRIALLPMTPAVSTSSLVTRIRAQS